MKYKSTFEQIEIYKSRSGTKYMEYEARGQALWGSVDLIERSETGNVDLKATLTAKDDATIWARSVRPGTEGVAIALFDDAVNREELSLVITDDQARVLRDQLNALYDAQDI